MQMSAKAGSITLEKNNYSLVLSQNNVNVNEDDDGMQTCKLHTIPAYFTTMTEFQLKTMAIHTKIKIQGRVNMISLSSLPSNSTITITCSTN